MPMTVQQANGIIKLAMQMAGNPKTRDQFFETAHAADPSIRLPADVQLRQFKQENKREREEDKIRAAAEREQEKTSSAREKLIASGRFTEDQVKEIETGVMAKFGISDYEAASKVYGADLKPAKADNRPRASSRWEMPQFEQFAKDPAKVANDIAYDLIDKARAGERIF